MVAAAAAVVEACQMKTPDLLLVCPDLPVEVADPASPPAHSNAQNRKQNTMMTKSSLLKHLHSVLLMYEVYMQMAPYKHNKV